MRGMAWETSAFLLKCMMPTTATSFSAARAASGHTTPRTSVARAETSVPTPRSAEHAEGEAAGPERAHGAHHVGRRCRAVERSEAALPAVEAWSFAGLGRRAG